MADESSTVKGQEPIDSGQEPTDRSGQKPQTDDGQIPESKTVTLDADYVRGLRAEASRYRVELKAFKDADDARQADADSADEERLKEQQKWQELAEKHEGKVTDVTSQLEASAKQVERLTAALGIYLEKEMAAVPEHLTLLLEKLDVVDRLAYLSENRDSLSPKKANGVPPSPAAGQTPAISEDERREKAFNIRL